MIGSLRVLPFLPRFKQPILTGEKTKTARTKKYGEPGDLLDTPFGTVRLLAVERVPLAEVAAKHFAQEGLTSPEAFEVVWCDIHPGRGFVPTDLVYLHTFQMVECSSFVWDGKENATGWYCDNCGVAHGPHGA